MSGRAKIKCYQYDFSGKYIQSWDSIAGVRDRYYGNVVGKYPIFRDNSSYHILPDDTIILKERIGRDNIRRLIARLNNPLIIDDNNLDQINILNMDGKVVATFANENIARELTAMTRSQMYSYRNRKTGSNLPHNKLRITVEYAT